MADIIGSRRTALNHFKKLTGIDLNIIDTQFNDKIHILSIDSKNTLKLKDKEEENGIKILRVLAWYFKENIDEFYMEIQVRITSCAVYIYVYVARLSISTVSNFIFVYLKANVWEWLRESFIHIYVLLLTIVRG